MLAPAAAGAVNESCGWLATSTPSVVSWAVNVTRSTVSSVTVNSTAPSVSVGPLAAEICAWLPASAVSVTVLPDTGRWWAADSSTRTTPVVEPSAGTSSNGASGARPGGPAAAATDSAGSTGPAAWPARPIVSRSKSNDPIPMWAKSDSMDAASWNAGVPASGYRAGLASPRLRPRRRLRKTVMAAHFGADRLVPPYSSPDGQPPCAAWQIESPCAGSAVVTTSGTERPAAAVRPSW